MSRRARAEKRNNNEELREVFDKWLYNRKLDETLHVYLNLNYMKKLSSFPSCLAHMLKTMEPPSMYMNKAGPIGFSASTNGQFVSFFSPIADVVDEVCSFTMDQFEKLLEGPFVSVIDELQVISHQGNGPFIWYRNNAY